MISFGQSPVSASLLYSSAMIVKTMGGAYLISSTDIWSHPGLLFDFVSVLLFGSR